MATEKLTKKEIVDLTYKMLDDAKGTIKGDEDVILSEDLGMMAYDMLWLSALTRAINKKNDTLLLKLLLLFKRLINEDYIDRIVEELDSVANEILDT